MSHLLVVLVVSVGIGALAHQLRSLPRPEPDERERFSETPTTQETVLWIVSAVLTILILGGLVWKLRGAPSSTPSFDPSIDASESETMSGTSPGSAQCTQDWDCLFECKEDSHCDDLGVDGVVCNEQKGRCQFQNGKLLSDVFGTSLVCADGQCVPSKMP